MSKIGCVWFRRDLRTYDHHALSKALSECDEVYGVFIFDTNIIKELPKDDNRITFIYESLVDMEEVFNKYQSSLKILIGKPGEELPRFLKENNITDLYLNRDYEPYAKKRDLEISKYCKQSDISFHTFKDSVIFEKNQIQNKSGKTYKVFTPYKSSWILSFEYNQEEALVDYKCNLKKLKKWKSSPQISSPSFLESIGFVYQENNILKGGSLEAKRKLDQFKKNIHEYKVSRDFPAYEKTSYLSPYIRHGNLSIRDMVRLSINKQDEGSRTWLSELIWRDFYQMILDSFPYVAQSSFKPEYDKIKWSKDKKLFKKWCLGQTGYPIIDAAMRCLNETGLMHNRLRMITASFLCKTLLIDWRMGEQYFALKLLDFDLAANNGGWQWCSSSGTDAQPYFRIFNPYTQVKKFDPEAKFIKKWCPELNDVPNKLFYQSGKLEEYLMNTQLFDSSSNYPKPIVNYEESRDKALAMYKKAIG